MIASARGLIVLGVITVSLAVAVLVGAPTAPITNRTLLPLFNPDAVSSITFSHAGKPDVGIILDEDTWRARKLSDADADFEVDRSTVEAALAALRGATWHRRAETAVANPTRGGIAVAGARGTIEVLIGREVPGSAQTWLVVWGQALLVDSWVAHALLPAALELRVRAPLASAPIAAMLRGPGVRVDGRFQTEPVKRWIAEPALNELVLALVDLTIVSLDGMHPAPAGRAVSVNPNKRSDRSSADILVAEAGSCDGDLIRIETNKFGSGCVERAGWQRVLAAFETLTRPSDPSLVDTRIVPFTPEGVWFQPDIADPTDRPALWLQGRIKIGMDDADVDRVNELLAALSTPGTVVPRPTKAPRMYISATGADDNRTRLSIFDGVIARADEPFALRPPPEVFAVITRPVITLRDPVLWREEVTTLTSFTLDGATYARGAVIGEWTRTPAGKVDAALVDSLASTLASVRGAASPFPAKVAHTISVTFTPPTGAPTTHALALAPPTAEGCAARVDDKPARLDLPLCLAAVALAAVR